MKIMPLYKYTRANGGISISPVKPDAEYTEMLRLVADGDKILTNGEITTSCIDVVTADGWYEVENTNEEQGGKE